MKKNKLPFYEANESLIMDRTIKQNYFLHFRDIEIWMEHKMTVTKRYTVHHFRQGPWLAKNFAK